jgi:hypothetical protein
MPVQFVTVADLRSICQCWTDKALMNKAQPVVGLLVTKGIE